MEEGLECRLKISMKDQFVMDKTPSQATGRPRSILSEHIKKKDVFQVRSIDAMSA